MRPDITQIWRQPRLRQWLARGAAACLLYLLAGFFLVPAVVRWQLLKQLPTATHRLTAVRQVRCNPLTLSLTIRGLSLTETNGQPFASFEEFYANFQLSSLFRWAWTFDEISLKEPRAEIILGPDGQFNFANLTATNGPAPQPKTKGGLPRLLVFNLSVTNGHAGFADLSRQTPFRTIYAPINLSLNGFTTTPDRQSPYSFNASSDSGRGIAWTGTVTAQPLGSTGSLRISGLQLPRHSPYIEEFTRAQLTDGTVDVAAHYSFSLGPNRTDLVVSNLTVTIARLQLKDPGTGEAVTSIPSLELREGTFDLRQRQVHIGYIGVNDPTALVRRRADGTINLPSLVLRRITTPPAQPVSQATTASLPVAAPWTFALDDYQLKGGSVQFEDATVAGPVRSLLAPVTVRVQHFSTATNAEAALQADLRTEANEGVSLTANYSLNPPRASSAVKLTAIDLKKYQAYLAPWFRGVLAAGKADVALESSLTLAAGTLQALVTNATVRLAGLQIQSADARETVLDLPELAVENASVNLADKALHIGAVRSSGTTISARREQDGSINLLRLLPPVTNTVTAASAATPTNAPSAPTAPGWRVALDELALRAWTLHLADRQLPQAGKLEVDQLALTLRGAQFPSNAPVALEFSTRLNAAGTVAAEGSLWPFSPAVDSQIQVAGLDLRAFQPWLQQQVRLTMQSGVLQATGRVEWAAPQAPGPKLHFRGALGISHLALVDQLLGQDFLGWDELAVGGIDFGLQPNQSAVETVKISGLKTSIIIDANKGLNFLALLPAARTNAPSAPLPAPTPAPAAKAGDSFPVQLGELKLEQGILHFSDQSVQPPCTFELQQLEGTVKGLSTRPDSTADIDLSGQFDAGSPFALRGKINPLAPDLTLDLVFTNHNLQLTPFTPYLEKYAGHPLHKGRLSLDLTYTLQSKALKAQNKVQLDQFMLGPRNDRPEATKLPLKLAIALLKDSNGRIDLDLPVEGRLDDPQFSVGPIILKVMGNVIVKAAASPFKLLGSLVGGGGEELSFVEFEPGQAQLLEPAHQKLAKLAQALEKRPSLNLEIEGAADPQADRDALARVLVRDQVKAQRRQELSAIGQTPASGPDFQLDPADYERLLRPLLVELYGPNLTAALAASTNRYLATAREPLRAPGVFTRATSLFKPGPERAAIQQAHQRAKTDALLRAQHPALAQLSAEDMIQLLAAKTEVPPDNLRQLIQDRAKAVQSYLLSFGTVTPERLFLVTPKVTDTAPAGEPRVHLSLN